MSSEEKHFAATPSRIAKARREGNVPRSQELGANAAFAAAAATVVAIAPFFAALSRSGIVSAARGHDARADAEALALVAMLPLCAAALASGAIGVLQSGVTVVAPAFKFERLTPHEGLKRMLSRETATHAARAALAFLLAGSAVAASIRAVGGIAATTSETLDVAAIAWIGAERAIAATVAVGALFALVEYGVARRTWLAKLRMTYQEFKREAKDEEGDQMARGRRASLHRSMIRGALSKVKDAAFVVVNPTHVAIALEYRPPDVPVPVVLVRAAGDMALRVRARAMELGVPVIEQASLARALYTGARVGDPIPHAHYVAVAEIVASLLRAGVL